MGVRDDPLDAARAAPRQLSQELAPERLGFRGADIQSQNLASAVAIDADGDRHGHWDDTAAVSNLYVGRIEPNVRPVAFDRATEERFDLRIDFLAQAAHLALGNALHSHGPDQIVDRAGRDALDIGFLHNGGDGLLRDAARFAKARRNSCPCGAWECAAPPFRRASPSRGRGSRCAGPGGRMNARHGRPRFGFQCPAPSGAGRRSRSSRADNWRRGSFPKGLEGPFCRWSSWVARLR